MERKLTTILSMDAVGYSRLMERDEAGTLARLKAIRAQVLNPAIGRHAGRVVKLMGDGSLVEFASVVAAVQCAVDIQRKLAGEDAVNGDTAGLQLRIGIHLGDVIVEDGDIYGDGVNIASRLESIAPPGGIVLSKQVHDHVGANVPVRFESLGKKSLKNIGRPILAYRVDLSSKDGSVGEIGSGDDETNVLAAMAGKPSVAVLPFANLNREADEDYLADGIAEDITTALSRNRWLAVIARNPAFAFRNSNESMKVIGAKLNANYIVTGSVRKSGQRFRITLQLVDTENEHSVWSERFDRDLVDIFDLQDEISETVAARIEAELGLSEQRKAQRRPRKNRGAWDFYQLGVAEFYKFTPESNQESQNLLRQSIEIDPEFASAHSRLAYAIVLNMVYFDAPPDRTALNEALASARRAIELDDQDANSYFTIGRVHLARREYQQAIDALQYALSLNPCLAVTYCGLGDSFAYEGRLDEAIEQFENAVRLSPHDPFRWAFFSYRSMTHLFRSEYSEAAAWARRSVQIPNAQYWARAHLVSALGHLGDEAETEIALRELLLIKPEFSLEFAREHLFYLKREDQLTCYLDGLQKAGVQER